MAMNMNNLKIFTTVAEMGNLTQVAGFLYADN